MRRISALLAISLTAALLIAMLAVGVASASSSHSANNAAEGHLFSASLAPVLGPKDPTIAGIGPGSFPWVLKSGHVNLSKGGLLEASVAGLLLGPGAPANLVGTTGPVKQVFASLICANGPVVVSTNPVALSTEGDAHIHQRIPLPARCVGPIVLIRSSLDGGPWLAASGF